MNRRLLLGLGCLYLALVGLGLSTFSLSTVRAADDAPPAGVRVFYTGHSFHMFVPGRVEQMVKLANIQGHKLVGAQGIGGSRTIQHWDMPDDKNKAKPALASGEVDVFTMAPHVLIPDPGIEKFTELALKHNPKARLLVQCSWFPFDVPAGGNRIKNNADRDNAKIADLQAVGDEWRKMMEAQVDELNQKAGHRALYIIPAGDAVVKLRAMIVDGKFPGITKQSELFTDPIGHGRDHVLALVAYCNYATIYRRSPVGLNTNDKTIDAAQFAILQQIAWDTVSKYPYAGIADFPAK